MGVSDNEELVLGEEDEGVSALERFQGLDDAGDERSGLGVGDEVEDDLGVGRGIEDGTIIL